MKKFGILIILALAFTVCLTGRPSESQNVAGKKFKVAVKVDDLDKNFTHAVKVESYVKRELRSLHDVEIVDDELTFPKWDYMIDISIMEVQYASGEKTGLASIGVLFFKKVPISNFKSNWQPHYTKFPAITLPIPSFVHSPTSKLDETSKTIVAGFDINVLELYR